MIEQVYEVDGMYWRGGSGNGEGGRALTNRTRHSLMINRWVVEANRKGRDNGKFQ